MKKLTLLLVLIFLFGACHKPPRPILMDELKSLSNLATTEFVFTKYLVINKDNKLFGLVKLGSAMAVLQSEATLKLGFDVSRLDASRIQIHDREIELLLPPLQIISFNYPIDKFVLLEKYSDPERKRRIINSQDWDKFYRQSQVVLQEHINSLAIAPEAEKRTALFIKSQLRQLGYTHVQVNFEANEKPLF